MLAFADNVRESKFDSDIDPPETVTMKIPNPAVKGAMDVMTFRALVEAVGNLKSHSKLSGAAFDRALAKTINVNGAVAEALLNGKR